MPLTPQDFVSKWKRAEARERQSVQEHFLDLCQLVGHNSPMQSDPTRLSLPRMGGTPIWGMRRFWRSYCP
jgi:hypothetical protein